MRTYFFDSDALDLSRKSIKKNFKFNEKNHLIFAPSTSAASSSTKLSLIKKSSKKLTKNKKNLSEFRKINTSSFHNNTINPNFLIKSPKCLFHFVIYFCRPSKCLYFHSLDVYDLDRQGHQFYHH